MTMFSILQRLIHLGRSLTPHLVKVFGRSGDSRYSITDNRESLIGHILREVRSKTSSVADFITTFYKGGCAPCDPRCSYQQSLAIIDSKRDFFEFKRPRILEITHPP